MLQQSVLICRSGITWNLQYFNQPAVNERMTPFITSPTLDCWIYSLKMFKRSRMLIHTWCSHYSRTSDGTHSIISGCGLEMQSLHLSVTNRPYNVKMLSKPSFYHLGLKCIFPPTVLRDVIWIHPCQTETLAANLPAEMLPSFRLSILSFYSQPVLNF